MVAGVNGGRVEIKRLKISAGERQIRGRGGGQLGSGGSDTRRGEALLQAQLSFGTSSHRWQNLSLHTDGTSLVSMADQGKFGLSRSLLPPRGGGGAKLVSGVPAAAPAAWRKKRRDGRARPRRLSRRLLALPEFRSLNQSHRWSAGVNCWRGRW